MTYPAIPTGNSLLFLFLLAVAQCGCLKLDQEVTIRPDGSGSIEVQYSISEQAVSRMNAMEKLREQLAVISGATPPPADTNRVLAALMDPNEDGIRSELRPYEKNGIRIERLKIQPRGAWRDVELKLAIRSWPEAGNTPLLREHGFRLARTAAGSYDLSRPAAVSKDMDGAVLTTPDATRILSPILQGFKVDIRMNVPGTVLQSNAHRASGKQVQWTFDFDRDPNALVKVQTQEFRIVFDGKGLSIPPFPTAPVRTAPTTR